ncbi:MAG: hypothetical protein JW836_02790 [Deltaproteobacteria bacterium]|nr:hypothetical protein [Deltaproteobacteria bacterium]
MKLDTQTALTMLAALGVDLFLLWSAKSKIVKSMWGFFGAFIVLMLLLAAVWDSLYPEPAYHNILLFLEGVTAASFIGGVIMAYITIGTNSE